MRLTRTVASFSFVWALTALGCADPVVGGGGTHRDAGRADGGGGGLDAGRSDGGGGGWDAGPDYDSGVGEPVGSGAVRPEICGNMFDDDDNGMIDDGCDCAVGTSRACWLGPPDARSIGACHDGIQRCESSGAAASWTYCLDQRTPSREILENGMDDDCDGTIDEPDGICVQTLNMEGGASCADGRDNDCDTAYDCDDPDCAGAAGCPPGCESTERLCWGGVDDDCDGNADCADTECATAPSCHTGPCPPGQTPTYRQRDLGSSYGASGITRGDGGPNMPVSCEMGACPAGQVAVVLVGQPRTCVPPPPDCPPGTSPNYVASGRWRCDGPCDLVIHYGSIYGGRNVCAPNVPTSPCPSGQSWTFREETEAWECRSTCDNSLYDRITIGGGVVCVPC